MVLIYGVRNADEAAYAAELKEVRVGWRLIVGHCWSRKYLHTHLCFSCTFDRKKAQAAGVVQLLVVAHAEDGVPVDVALGQHAEVVWGLINQGAYVYVCGGASVSRFGHALRQG